MNYAALSCLIDALIFVAIVGWMHLERFKIYFYLERPFFRREKDDEEN